MIGKDYETRQTAPYPFQKVFKIKVFLKWYASQANCICGQKETDP